MDTFVDSSWYWFRYLDPHNDTAPFDPEKIKGWTPVDLYTGGIEHAILHLLYARFFTRRPARFRSCRHDEPFAQLRNQGIILSTEGVKMSKSRGTQVNPDPIVAEHGADTVRLHLMFLGPWDQGGPWNDRGLNGMERFLRRVYDLVQLTVDAPSSEIDMPERDAILRLTHRTIKRVSTDLADFQFNTQIAAMIELTNELMRHKDTRLVGTPEWRFAVETLVSLLAPSAPHLGEEMWQMLGQNYSVHTSALAGMGRGDDRRRDGRDRDPGQWQSARPYQRPERCDRGDGPCAGARVRAGAKPPRRESSEEGHLCSGAAYQYRWIVHTEAGAGLEKSRPCLHGAD